MKKDRVIIKEIFRSCDEMIKSFDIDFNDLKNQVIDSSFLMTIIIQ
ncbi:hypothetical protein RZR97_01810 [Hydrogenimonas thermophila]|nr:hypothetical protein [Hydrogenimonas thermophila]WOE70320.1 hypothetical protein RZR91_01820 [Hydrogenimonas thermophila]WOE72837.1 hypothetical protein RZR97_01810 [Hydrogenimonas thermophila]